MINARYRRRDDAGEIEKLKLHTELLRLSRAGAFRLRIDAGKVYMAPINGVELDVSWEFISTEKARRIVDREYL